MFAVAIRPGEYTFCEPVDSQPLHNATQFLLRTSFANYPPYSLPRSIRFHQFSISLTFIIIYTEVLNEIADIVFTSQYEM